MINATLLMPFGRYLTAAVQWGHICRRRYLPDADNSGPNDLTTPHETSMPVAVILGGWACHPSPGAMDWCTILRRSCVDRRCITL